MTRVSPRVNLRAILSASCALVAVALALLASGATSHAQTGTVAYRGATLETIGPSGRLENATLVIKDGKIIDVGVDIDLPDDARVIDATGKTIMPGIVDPYFVFSQQVGGFGGRGGARGGRGGRGGFQQPQAPTGGGFRRLADYFYPYDVDLIPASRSGITTANLVESGTGQSAIAQVLPNDLENLLVQPDGFLFAAVTNQTSSLNFVRNGLNPQAANRGGRGAGARGRGGFGGRGRRGGNQPLLIQDQDQQDQDDDDEQEEDDPSATERLWNQVRDGEKPLFVNVNNAATVLYLLQALEDYEDVRVGRVCSGSNLYNVMSDLTGRNVTLILQPAIDTLPFNSERFNAARMAEENDVPYVLSLSLNRGQMNAHQDDPLFAVAMLVKSGISRESALHALTLGPAKLLGMEKELGSLEENKQANLLIFDGDPLETGSRLEQVMVEGRTVHEN